ncbi:hypothetical protein [Pseudomonas lijiangensis]|uniref:Uncharacterized protein n=1 Tax=Pseudomonas lijiangensis TaxID=2995658 RepID=A0ABX8HXP4_9PSED|nr:MULTISPECIES: hypothetical protein [Pseudomonas syringae group]MBX8488760.1 hypothetical protein [Pseudomonas cichorii]MBX8498706.1 hypothetical protein [Pseudomonas lijiangensis]MBX8507754.1 hypothetical protein [Pseudomonas lijiangensis]QWU85431.1 hypothetical protein KQP88_11965 [Pseudomonas lijiangensis]
MIGVTELKAHHKLTNKALDIHRQWIDLNANELLPLAVALKGLALSVIDLSGSDWDRRSKLQNHLCWLITRLQQNDKESCKSDIDDLIYIDLPALGAQLMRLFESARQISR